MSAQFQHFNSFQRCVHIVLLCIGLDSIEIYICASLLDIGAAQGAQVSE